MGVVALETLSDYCPTLFIFRPIIGTFSATKGNVNPQKCFWHRKNRVSSILVGFLSPPRLTPILYVFTLLFFES